MYNLLSNLKISIDMCSPAKLFSMTMESKTNEILKFRLTRLNLKSK